MYGSIHGFFCIFIQIFISFSRYSSHLRYSLSYFCGNKSNHQVQAGGNADGDAEAASKASPDYFFTILSILQLCTFVCLS